MTFDVQTAFAADDFALQHAFDFGAPPSTPPTYGGLAANFPDDRIHRSEHQILAAGVALTVTVYIDRRRRKLLSHSARERVAAH